MGATTVATTNGGGAEPTALDLTFHREAQNLSVCVVDGYGAEIGTSSGRLVIRDGIGRTRRMRTFSRATHGLARLVVMAGSGNVTLDAIRWLDGAGVSWVVLEPADGRVVSSSTRALVDDARLRRAQALAPGTVIGLDVIRWLIGRKLAGQSAIARVDLGSAGVAGTIHDLASRLADSATLEEVRQIEAAAANVYWSAWGGVTATFVRKDDARVPDHWKGFIGRRSAINPGIARNATDVANCLLNYSYKLLEAEGLLATHAVGLDPGMGILHADIRGRDSLVLDVIESVRPDVDRHVLRLLMSTPLRWRDFDEDQRGVVRVLAPLSHRLAEAMPSYAVALAPVVEWVASTLGRVSPYEVPATSVLTRSRHREAARIPLTPSSGKTVRGTGADGIAIPRRQSPRQQPSRAQVRATTLMPTCKLCGAEIPREASRPRSRAGICGDCLPGERARIAEGAQRAGRDVPRQVTAESANRRRWANEEQRLAEQRFDLEHLGEAFDRNWYLRQVLPGLAGISTVEIARVTGMSTSSASKIRAGKRVPHPRWWGALSAMSSSTG